MFVGAQRYKSINQFINLTQDKKIKSNPTAGASAYCGAIDYNKLLVDHATCFSCMFCLLKDKVSYHSYMKSEYLRGEIEKRNEKLFNGSLVDTILPNLSMIAKFKSFENFTSVNETQHISPWAAGILEETSSKPVRIGLEVAVPNIEYDRPGRLDVCAITEDYLLMFEAKISLEEALSDERFIEQFQKYLSVIDDAVSAKKLPYNLILLIGGKETDLLYPDHPECTSNVGNLSKRFYKILTDYNIKFMSANSLWLMSIGYLLNGNKFSWDNFIRKIFDDEQCIGLITAGKIISSNGVFNIKSL